MHPTSAQVSWEAKDKHSTCVGSKQGMHRPLAPSLPLMACIIDGLRDVMMRPSSVRGVVTYVNG